jgi:hypothetical protein
MPPSQKLRSFVNAGSTTIHNYYRLCFIYILHSGVYSCARLLCTQRWRIWHAATLTWWRARRGGVGRVPALVGHGVPAGVVCGSRSRRRRRCMRGGRRAREVGTACRRMRPTSTGWSMWSTFPAANVRGEFRRIWPEPATSTSASAGVCHTPSFTACAPPSSRPYV